MLTLKITVEPDQKNQDSHPQECGAKRFSDMTKLLHSGVVVGCLGKRLIEAKELSDGNTDTSKGQ